MEPNMLYQLLWLFMVYSFLGWIGEIKSAAMVFFSSSALFLAVHTNICAVYLRSLYSDRCFGITARSRSIWADGSIFCTAFSGV